MIEEVYAQLTESKIYVLDFIGKAINYRLLTNFSMDINYVVV